MNAAHVHLALTHLPVMGIFLGTVLYLFGVIARQVHYQRIALFNFILMALAAIPVFLSGEPAEEVVEDLSGISEQMIERHESLAEIALWGAEALGLAALISLIWINNPNLALRRALRSVVLLLAVIISGVLFKTANLGGQIRHPEISNFAASQLEAEPDHSQQNDDDD